MKYDYIKSPRQIQLRIRPHLNGFYLRRLIAHTVGQVHYPRGQRPSPAPSPHSKPFHQSVPPVPLSVCQTAAPSPVHSGAPVIRRAPTQLPDSGGLARSSFQREVPLQVGAK